MLSEALPNSRAPSLRGHYPASSLPRAPPPPSRRQPLSRGHRLYGLPCSADFAAGRGGLLQWLLHVSWSPCRRSHPAGGDRRVSQTATLPAAFARTTHARPPELGVFEATSAFTQLRPGNSLTILPMASSMGSRGSVSLRPAIQATGRLALVPVGLSPTEHVCLWIARRVEGWRGTRSARLQPPPVRTAHTDFPYAALLPASRQGLCDLSGWARFQARI